MSYLFIATRVAFFGIVGLRPIAAFAQYPPAIRMSAVVYGGHSLRGDGFGPYADKEKGSMVFGRMALSAFAWGQVDSMSNKPSPDAEVSRERSMIFDLTRPVPGSGATKVQTTNDYLARFHAFWKHDHEVEKIFVVNDIPIGATVETDRVEMWAVVKGVQNVLQMGPWAMGEFSPRAALNGTGTTKAKITRETEDSWRIIAPKESIARLWEYSDIQNPVDKGLYYFDFDVKFTRLK